MQMSYWLARFTHPNEFSESIEFQHERIVHPLSCDFRRCHFVNDKRCRFNGTHGTNCRLHKNGISFVCGSSGSDYTLAQDRSSVVTRWHCRGILFLLRRSMWPFSLSLALYPSLPFSIGRRTSSSSTLTTYVIKCCCVVICVLRCSNWIEPAIATEQTSIKK